MFDFGDGFSTIYTRSYCVDDYGNAVATDNALRAALEFARDHATPVKFFPHQGA